MSTKSSRGDARQTRQAIQKELERKKVHAEYKRKYRAQLSSQKKRQIKEKDAAKKRLKRQEKKSCKQSIEPEPTEHTKPSSSSSSLAAWQKTVYRAKKKLPKSPSRYAAVVKGLATRVTPKRKEALRQEGILSSPNAKRNLEQFMNIMKDVHPAPEELKEPEVDDIIDAVPQVPQAAEIPHLPDDVPPAEPHILQGGKVPQAPEVMVPEVPKIVPALNNPDAIDIEDQSLYGDLSSVDADVSLGDMNPRDGDVSLTTLLESLDSEPQYKKGDFVVAQLRSGKRSVDYVAEIKRLLPNNEVVLQYMEKTVIHGESFYHWPTNDDVSQEHMDSIVKRLSDPILVEERSKTRLQVYRFI